MIIRYQKLVDRLNNKRREHADVPWYVWVLMLVIAGMIMYK